MKKIAAIMISIMMILSLTACGGPSPTEVSDKFLTAIKNADSEALAECYVEDEFDLFEEASEAAESDEDESDKEDEESDDALTKVYDEKLIPKMLEFEYELSNEKIEGDKATVDVTVKTYQLGSAFSSFFSEYITQAFALAFSDASDEQMNALAANILTGQLDNMTEKTYEKTATLSLIKRDDKWLVDSVDGNKDVLNALSGGLVESISNMATAFDE